MAIKCPQCGAEYDVTLFTLDRSIRCDCGANVDLAVGHQQTSEDGMQVVSPEGSREGVSPDNEPERNGINALGDAVHVEALDARMPPTSPRPLRYVGAEGFFGSLSCISSWGASGRISPIPGILPTLT